MRSIVPTLTVLALLAAAGTCALSSAGAPTPTDGLVAGTETAPRGIADAPTAPIAARAPRARVHEPVAAPGESEPSGDDLATSDTFPPFEHSGGPLLVRSDDRGTFVLDAAGGDAWRCGTLFTFNFLPQSASPARQADVALVRCDFGPAAGGRARGCRPIELASPVRARRGATAGTVLMGRHPAFAAPAVTADLASELAAICER